MKRMLLLFAAAGVLLAAGCVIINRVTERTTDHQLATARVRQFKYVTKAHLADGSLVVFPKGFKVDLGHLVGDGLKYDLTRRPVGPVAAVALDSVLSLQHYPRRWDWDASLVSFPPAALLATAGTLAVGLLLFPPDLSCDLNVLPNPVPPTMCYQPPPLAWLWAVPHRSRSHGAGQSHEAKSDADDASVSEEER